MIRLLVPDMPSAGDLLGWLERIDESHWYTNNGPLWGEFALSLVLLLEPDPEHRPFVLPVASATLGLQILLASLCQHKKHPRVLLPSLTFTATAQVVNAIGGVPVLADVDPSSWTLTPGIARAMCDRYGIDVVMPVATFGCALPAQAWRQFESDTGIRVVIDAAGAFGNQQVQGLHVVFSFHATKALACGEGGLICTPDAMRQRDLMCRANFGIDATTGIVDRDGTNAKMSEYHAAVGLASLTRWRDAQHSRRRLHAEYCQALMTADVVPRIARLQERSPEGVYTIMPSCSTRRETATSPKCRSRAHRFKHADGIARLCTKRSGFRTLNAPARLR